MFCNLLPNATNRSVGKSVGPAEWVKTGLIGAICYQIATKKLTSGFGAEPWGIGPFTIIRRGLSS
jgi:hypothetical protein